MLGSDLFALVIFLNDGYLKFKEETGIEEKHKHFFSILMKLPLDIQMFLCNKCFGVTTQFIKHTYIEYSFKKLGYRFKPRKNECKCK